MSTPVQSRTVTIALIGNPNTGKSTLFNALCGLRQRVGNYPGVTVEKKVGRTTFHERHFEVIDLPGSYSLAPRSPDEMITVDVLLGRRSDVSPPDVVICIVDASNLERNLYLVSQLLELGLPTVLALNMLDLAHEKGTEINIESLRQRLPIPIVETQAHRRIGLAELQAAVIKAVESPPQVPPSPFPEAFQREVLLLGKQCQPELPRYLVERLLLDTSGYLAEAQLPGVNDALHLQIAGARERLAAAGLPVPAVEALARYGWASEITRDAVTRPTHRPLEMTERVDRVVTHRVWGCVIFAIVMLLLFQSVFSIAEPASWAIDMLNGQLGNLVRANFSDGALRSLLINGVIEGVGGVLVFLPQIFMLFFFIAVLEDCGYMSRAAYLMDKLMSRIGLSGKSFIPLLSSFACAIPGIMSARVIENPKDRLLTILIAPLMSCSARLPVYTLLIGAFIPDARYLAGLVGLRGLTMFAMYGVGVLAAVVVALLLRNTVLRGPTPPFVMELPSYKLPSVSVVVNRMLDRGWAFVQRAGTLIFAVTIVVWAAAYYPRDPDRIDRSLQRRHEQLSEQIELATAPESVARLQSELRSVDNKIAGEHLRNSFLGRSGHFVEPLVKPLGWDWRLGCAAIASFPAREVVIATLGVVYNLGEEEDEESETLRQTLRQATWEGTDRPVFDVPVALSLMVFFALCAQCASTLVVIRRETNSWPWTVFTFVYMTVLAYVAAMLTYQIGSLF